MENHFQNQALRLGSAFHLEINFIAIISDPALHHHPARAVGPHPARPRGEELPGAGACPAGGPQQADA